MTDERSAASPRHQDNMSGKIRRWVVDSVEEGVASVEEDGARMLRVPAWILPAGAREGDVLSVAHAAEGDAATLRITIDRAATEEALRRSREQLGRRARGEATESLEVQPPSHESGRRPTLRLRDRLREGAARRSCWPGFRRL